MMASISARLKTLPLRTTQEAPRAALAGERFPFQGL
jgi:hypothetical protein